MRLFTCLAILVATTISVIAADNDKSSASAALKAISELAGNWQGTFQWSGARTEAGKLTANYYKTGNGSAVIENLIMEGDVPSMTSAYHLDGNDLRMTHYCAAQNQPRLKASLIDLNHGIINFDFVDATNLRSPDAPHVVGLEMHLVSPDHITFTFLFQGAGKISREQIELSRLPAHSP